MAGKLLSRENRLLGAAIVYTVSEIKSKRNMNKTFIWCDVMTTERVL